MSAQPVDPSELDALRQTIKSLLKNKVAPYYEQWEKASIFPREVWLQLGEAGLLAVDVEEEFGGFDAPFIYSTIVLDEISRAGFGALSSSISVHSDIVAPYISHLGTHEQKKKWLKGMVTGEAVGAIAMTEPGAGSDLQGMRTSAKKKDDCYIINGQKTFITNGQHADVVIVAAKTDPAAGAKGISLFLVDANTKGFAKGRNLEKLGYHSGDTSEIYFEDVSVHESQLLGEEGKGFIHLMEELPRERLVIAVIAVAAAEGALDWTVDYVRERHAFGQPIAQFQNTRFKLAEAKTDIEVHRAYLEKCIAQYINSELDAQTGALVKLATTEMQGRVVDSCLQLFGGYGYMMEYPIARAFADARVQRIYGGTSEIMKEVIARSFLGR